MLTRTITYTGVWSEYLCFAVSSQAPVVSNNLIPMIESLFSPSQDRGGPQRVDLPKAVSTPHTPCKTPVMLLLLRVNTYEVSISILLILIYE